MKKLSLIGHNRPERKLVLHRETIARLTPDLLSQVIGGSLAPTVTHTTKSSVASQGENCATPSADDGEG